MPPSPAAELHDTSLAFSDVMRSRHPLTNGNRMGAYPGQMLMLNGLDLAAGGPERSPASGLLRSGSDSTSEATKLAEQACRVSSPFPGTLFWCSRPRKEHRSERSHYPVLLLIQRYLT